MLSFLRENCLCHFHLLVTEIIYLPKRSEAVRIRVWYQQSIRFQEAPLQKLEFAGKREYSSTKKRQRDVRILR